MITVNEADRSVTVTDSTGDFVRIDGIEYELSNYTISLVNLPSFYDVVVYKKIEENHIERLFVVEPEIIVEEIVFEEEIVEPITEPEL